MRGFLVAILLLAWSAGFVPDASASRLCFGPACRDAVCGAVVEIDEVARPFVITSATQDEHVLGTLEAGARDVTCGGTRVELRVTQPGVRGNARLVLTGDRELRWEVPVAERQFGEPVVLTIPKGEYSVEVSAEHAIRHRSTLNVGDEPLRLAIQLQPLPILSGVVKDKRTGGLLAGVVIEAGDGREAVTDATGMFRIELDPERWPERITIEALGFATKTVSVPGARANAKLDEIQLSLAGAITVQVEQPNPGEVLRIELLRQAHDRRESGVVASSEVSSSAAAPLLRFDALEPGHYIVLAQGDEPWERRGELVDLRDGEQRELRLHIAPFRVDLKARIEGQPLPYAIINLRNRDGEWSGRFEANDVGEASVQLWQGGRITAGVRGGVMTAPHFERRSFEEGVDAEWLLNVPNYEITGLVLDSRTGEPVSNAAIALNIAAEGNGMSLTTRADEKGSFRFAPVPHGKHTLKAAAALHPPGEITYTFLAPDTSRNVMIRLDPAAAVALKVIDGNGAPVAGARVIHCRGLAVVGISTTDAGGDVTVAVADEDAQDVYVIPREGSFAFTTLQGGSPAVTLRVPLPASTVMLRTESTDRVPIPNIAVIVRYNGRVLPPAVLEALVTMQGSRVNSDTQGRIVLRTVPLGVYEFWPVGSDGELRELAAGLGPEAPAKIAVAPGENVAVLTFSPVERQNSP